MDNAAAKVRPQKADTSAHRARIAVTTLFLMHGILTGGWVPHIPLAKDELNVGTGVFGWILLGLAAGGVIAMPVAGVLIHRFGSALVCRACGLAMCLAFALPVYASTELTLTLSLLVFGAALGSLDVAMNAHGVAVEHQLGRAVMSAFHGWYSVGAALGAGLGGVMVGSLGATAHVAATLTLAIAMLALSSRLLLPSGVDRGHSGSHFSWPTRATLALGALAFLALLIEGATLDWSALYLQQTVGAPVTLASFGFAAFSAGMAVVRFAGDALRMKFGSASLVRASALAVVAGMAIAITIPHALLAVAAFAVAGLGVGNIAPVLFAGGGRAEPDAPGRGIAAVTTMGYSGFLLGPPVIGMAAELTGLRVALALTVVAALAIAGFARAARAADGATREG